MKAPADLAVQVQRHTPPPESEVWLSGSRHLRAAVALSGAYRGALNRRAADIEPRTSAMRRGTDLNPGAAERRLRAKRRH